MRWALALLLPLLCVPASAQYKLADLRTLGFAIVPLRTFVGAGDAREIKLAMQSLPAPGGGHIYERGLWKPDAAAEAPLQDLVYGLATGLDSALPGEDFQLHGAWTRRYAGQELIGNFPHVDPEEYLTAALSFGAPGTLAYEIEGTRVLEYPASDGEVAILSGKQRQAVMGVPASVHRAPTGRFRWRGSLFAVFRSAAASFGDPRLDAEVDRRIARVRGWLGAF